MQNDVILKGSQQRIFNNENDILIACSVVKTLIGSIRHNHKTTVSIGTVMLSLSKHLFKLQQNKIRRKLSADFYLYNCIIFKTSFPHLRKFFLRRFRRNNSVLRRTFLQYSARILRLQTDAIF